MDEKEYGYIKQIELLKKLHAEAVLVRDKQFVQMVLERSELMKLTDQLNSVIDYHLQKAEYLDKLIEKKKSKS